MIDSILLVNVKTSTYVKFSFLFFRLAKFSKMGHLFAAAQGNIIQVYSTISFELMHVLKGHNGMVGKFPRKTHLIILFIILINVFTSLLLTRKPEKYSGRVTVKFLQA